MRIDIYPSVGWSIDWSTKTELEGRTVSSTKRRWSLEHFSTTKHIANQDRSILQGLP